jgi:hypothetical protein
MTDPYETTEPTGDTLFTLQSPVFTAPETPFFTAPEKPIFSKSSLDRLFPPGPMPDKF